jgi:hypothetical protein
MGIEYQENEAKIDVLLWFAQFKFTRVYESTIRNGA